MTWFANSLTGVQRVRCRYYILQLVELYVLHTAFHAVFMVHARIVLRERARQTFRFDLIMTRLTARLTWVHCMILRYPITQFRVFHRYAFLLALRREFAPFVKKRAIQVCRFYPVITRLTTKLTDVLSHGRRYLQIQLGVLHRLPFFLTREGKRARSVLTECTHRL